MSPGSPEAMAPKKRLRLNPGFNGFLTFGIFFEIFRKSIRDFFNLGMKISHSCFTERKYQRGKSSILRSEKISFRFTNQLLIGSHWPQRVFMKFSKRIHNEFFQHLLFVIKLPHKKTLYIFKKRLVYEKWVTVKYQ